MSERQTSTYNNILQKKRNYFNIPAAPKTPEVKGDFENDFFLVMLIKTQPV